MTEERAAAADEIVFTTNLTAFALVMRFQTESARYFRFEREAPNGCRWIVLPTGEQDDAAAFLLNNLRTLEVELALTGPIETFLEGEKACHLERLVFGFQTTPPASPQRTLAQTFFVDELISEEVDGVERRIFTLNQAKDGCNRIVFTFQNQQQLESALMQCFTGPRSFDFEIDEDLGDGCCTIRSIRLR